MGLGIDYHRNMNKIKLSTALEEELDIVLETALMLAEPGTSLSALGQRIYDSESRLMAQIHRPWIVDGLIWRLRRKKANIPVQDQMSLPGFPILPIRATLKNGKRPYLGDATIKDLREFKNILAKRKSSRLRTVERLIELMAPYAKKNPKITVTGVIRSEYDKQQS